VGDVMSFDDAAHQCVILDFGMAIGREVWGGGILHFAPKFYLAINACSQWVEAAPAIS